MATEFQVILEDTPGNLAQLGDVLGNARINIEAIHGRSREASKTLHGISGLDVVSTTATVKDNAITEYRATVKVAFLIEKQ